MDYGEVYQNKKYTQDERSVNISYLRKLYSLYFVENTMAMLFIFVCSYWSPETVGTWVNDNFWLGVVTGTISLFQLILTAFFKFTRETPANWLIYITFTLVWMYTMGYFSVLDGSSNFIYIYSQIFTVSTAFLLQSAISSGNMSTLAASMWIILSTFICFQIFIIWSKIDQEYLAIWLAVVWIFAFYQSQEVRNQTKNDVFDRDIQDCVSGAVRIWVEASMVFFRVFELIAGIFVKNK